MAAGTVRATTIIMTSSKRKGLPSPDPLLEEESSGRAGVISTNANNGSASISATTNHQHEEDSAAAAPSPQEQENDPRAQLADHGEEQHLQDDAGDTDVATSVSAAVASGGSATGCGGPAANPSAPLLTKTEEPATTQAEADQDEDPPCCPICLESSRPLARGASCTHAFCQPCLKELLLGSHLFEPTGRRRGGEDGSDGDDDALRVPTQGPCPLCRQRLSLFDLRWVHIPADMEEEKDKDGRGDDDAVVVGSLLYPCTTPWHETPLAGHVYVTAALIGYGSPTLELCENSRGVGWGSIHFDTEVSHAPAAAGTGGDETAEVEGAVEGAASPSSSWAPPYFNIELAQQQGGPRRNRTPHRLELQNVHWHAPHTLAGIVMLDDNPGTAGIETHSQCPMQGHEKWEVFLTFEPNFAYVQTGAIVKVWKAWGSVDERQVTYPLDGTWKIVRPPPSTTTTTTPGPVTIHVLANRFHRMDGNSNNNNDAVGFVSVDRDRATATLAVGSLQLRRVGQVSWDWDQYPRGPDDGERLVWRRDTAEGGGPDNDDTGTEEVFEEWVRVARSTNRPPNEVNYLGGDPARTYRRLPPAVAPRTPPTYHAGTLIGNTFCQGFTVGLASYHFEAPDRIYISYEHISTLMWPPLDNGMDIPARAHFQDVSFPNPTTFRGSICWQDTYGTTWQRMSRWDYEMHFDSLYTCIVGGTVRCHSLRRRSVRELSRFEDDLVYINAALYSVFRPPPTEAVSSGGHPTVMNESRELRERLQAEGASVRTIAAVHRVWTTAQQPAGTVNPICFNL